MADPIVIMLGSGGHASVLLDTLSTLNVRVTCIADPGRDRGPTDFFGLECIGNDDDVLKRDRDAVVLVNGIGSTSRPRQRDAAYQKFKAAGFHFLSIIHPSAIVGSHTVIGEGAQIMAGAIIQVASQIGANTIINTRASVDHHSIIGESTHIAPGATICGNVQIGAGTMIGAGATVIQGLKIGASCLIGAGIVVRGIVPSGDVRI